MVTKLTKHGNEPTLIIDRSPLQLLEIDPKTLSDVSTAGDQLIVTRAAKSSTHRKRFEEAQEWAHARFSNALKKLAE